MTQKHETYAFYDEVDDTLTYRHGRCSVGKCKYCDTKRVHRIVSSFIRRLDESGTDLEGIFLWSLGTSLTDTKANRRLLNQRWRLFTKRMNHNSKWQPLFRVRETGRRGFLHFHVICGKFIPHSEVIDEWRSLTREKSNVHVSGYKGARNPRLLIGYLVKYLSKETSAYRWMGPLYGNGGRVQGPAGSGGTTDPSRHRYMGVVQGWTKPHSVAWPEKNSQRNINE